MASSPLPAGDQASTQYSRLLKLRWLLMAVFVAVILLSLVADFMLGPSGLSWSELMRTLFSPDQAEPTTSVIVWDVRLPYAVIYSNSIEFPTDSAVFRYRIAHQSTHIL